MKRKKPIVGDIVVINTFDLASSYHGSLGVVVKENTDRPPKSELRYEVMTDEETNQARPAKQLEVIDHDFKIVEQIKEYGLLVWGKFEKAEALNKLIEELKAIIFRFARRRFHSGK